MRNHLLISLGMCYILGLEHPAYFESVPVSFITDESGGQIAVVSLDKDVDHTKVYVNPNNDDDNDDKDEEEAAEKAKDNQTAVPLEVEDVEITDDGDDKSDSDVDKMDGDDDEVDGGDIDDSEDDCNDDNDDDYNEDDDEDDDDEDEDDDMDDSDYEFIPKSKEKLVVEKKSTDDDDDAVTGEGDDRGKQAVHRKRKPNIKEIAILDADNGLGNSIFDVHLCQSVIKPSCI